MTHDLKNINRARPIKSYVIRASRITNAQKLAIEKYWKLHVLEFTKTPIDLSHTFKDQSPLIVEVGFGMGDSLLEMAKNQPDKNFIGIETHKPGVGKLLHGIISEKLANLKIFCHDAKEVLNFSIGKNTVSKLLIFFPDPWHKKKHNKRRLIQTDFIGSILPTLKEGGCIHLATDWHPYAEHMMEVLESTKGTFNLMGPRKFSLNPDRPPTKFEKRGKLLGHSIYDLVFTKKTGT
ncbi:tRNA (guanosine(46)-N7)-methyltransferase TrmB [Gammaproteobacteria bacterium]|nr:tRNA (guanosine(46)-N7)-methyltransferase TrmB [Gammaproteobacteria bacterium]